MTQPNPPSSTTVSEPTPPKKKKWLKRLLILGGVLLVGLVILVALGPTIASTSPARSFIVGKVNQQLDGKLEIADWSIGWHGISVTNIKLFDKDGKLAIEIPRLKTDLALLDAARGNFNLGDTQADVHLARVEIRPDGSSNVQDIFERYLAQPSEPLVKLPDASGKLTLNISGDVDLIPAPGQPAPPRLSILPTTITVNIPDINSPIENDIKLAYTIDQRQSALNVSGKVGVIQANQINLAALRADQKVELASVDLAALNPILRMIGQEATLGGIAKGALQLKATSINDASAEGRIDIAQFTASAPQLKGDTYTSPTVAIPIKLTSSQQNGRTRVVGQIRADTQESFFAFSCDTPLEAIQDAAAGRKSTDQGWVDVTLAVNELNVLLGKLPNTVALMPGVAVTSGKLSNSTKISITPEGVFVKNQADVNVAGTNNGQAVSLEPTSISFDTTLKPGDDPLKRLADMALIVTSPFAQVRGGGPNAGQIKLDGQFDLGKLRQQVAQFVDLKEIQLAGNGSFGLASTGDLTQPNSAVNSQANLGLNNVTINLPGDKSLRIGFLSSNTSAVLATGGTSVVRAIKSLNTTARSGETAESPILDLAANASNIDLGSMKIEHFNLTKLAITSFPKLQQQFGSLIPQLREQAISLDDGALVTSVSGSYDGATGTLKLDKPLDAQLTSVTLRKGDLVVLNRENIRALLLGTIQQSPTALSANLSQLAVDSSLFKVSKSEAPFVFSRSANGLVSGNGELHLSADVKRLSDLGLSMSKTDPRTLPAQLQSGALDATLSVSRGDKPETNLNIAGAITGLTVVTPQDRIENEQLKFALMAASADDLSGVQASGSVNSTFVEAQLTNAQLKLATLVNGQSQATGVWDMLQRANVRVGINSLPRTQALLMAFMPPSADSGVANTTAAPIEPLLLVGGAGGLSIDVARDSSAGVTRINITDAKLAQIGLRRGQRTYNFDANNPVVFKLSAEVAAAEVAGKSAVEQISSIKVTQLEGDARAARLSMPEPIVVTNLSAPSPTAKGQIQATGEIADVVPLLSVLQGADPLPYRGAFNVTQTLGTTGNQLTLVGSATVNDFVALAKGSNQPAITEKQILVRNDLAADLQNSNAIIRSLAVEMPQSKAAQVSITGGITDWVTRRQFDNIKVDVGYDAPKVWQLVKPMLDPKTQESLKTLQLEGSSTAQFVVRGALPSNIPFNEAVKQVIADGRLGLNRAQWNGLDIQRIDAPIAMRDGVVRTVFGDRPEGQNLPAAISVNGGALTFGDIRVDLTGDAPRITTPKELPLLRNVTINPVLANSLGKFANPIFPNSSKAEGLLDVTINYCDGVALGEKLGSEQSGKAKVLLSVRQLEIVNPLGGQMLGGLMSIFGNQSFAAGRADSFKGYIRDAVIELDRGRTTQNLTMVLQEPIPNAQGTVQMRELPMSFKGDIQLSNLNQRFNVNIPTGLFVNDASTSDISKGIRMGFPDGIPLVLKGTTVKTEVDFGGIAQKFIEGQAKAGLGNLLGGGKAKDGEKKDDPVGGLIDLLGGKKKKDKKN